MVFYSSLSIEIVKIGCNEIDIYNFFLEIIKFEIVNTEAPKTIAFSS